MKTIPEPQRSQTINRIIKRLSEMEEKLDKMDDEYRNTNKKWEPWFAWRPVTTLNGDHIWGKKIYRRTQQHYDGLQVWHTYQYGTDFDILKDV